MSLQYAAADPLIWTHDHVIKRIGGGLKAVVLSSERLGQGLRLVMAGDVPRIAAARRTRAMA